MPSQFEGLREKAEEILLAEAGEKGMDLWARQCHAASIELMRSGEFGCCRVARGTAKHVFGQHSWLVLGGNEYASSAEIDVYDKRNTIIDPTLWSQSEHWQHELGPRVWVGRFSARFGHRPHGSGSIWEFGRPEEPTGPIVELTPRKPFSFSAENFLHHLGPLDQEGWIKLAHFPMEGWPSGEIVDAICESGLAGYVPIDIRGMLTDRNPSGLYLPEKEGVEHG